MRVCVRGWDPTNTRHMTALDSRCRDHTRCHDVMGKCNLFYVYGDHVFACVREIVTQS